MMFSSPSSTREFLILSGLFVVSVLCQILDEMTQQEKVCGDYYKIDCILTTGFVGSPYNIDNFYSQMVI
jgi:hypothetical protein